MMAEGSHRSHPEALQLSPRRALARGDHPLDGPGTGYIAGRRDRGGHEDVGVTDGATVVRGVGAQATWGKGVKAEAAQQPAKPPHVRRDHELGAQYAAGLRGQDAGDPAVPETFPVALPALVPVT